MSSSFNVNVCQHMQKIVDRRQNDDRYTYEQNADIDVDMSVSVVVYLATDTSNPQIRSDQILSRKCQSFLQTNPKSKLM